MTNERSPDVMRDPRAALELHKRGEWRMQCPVERCKTDLQGGQAGVDAHLRVVHPREARLRGLK